MAETNSDWLSEAHYFTLFSTTHTDATVINGKRFESSATATTPLPSRYGYTLFATSLAYTRPYWSLYIPNIYMLAGH